MPDSDALPLPLHKRPIEPVVLRHVQDAAWLWAQLPDDACSPLMDRQRAAHFQTMLACHLDGVYHAGALGRALAQKELKRWKGAEQYFVCWHVALRDADAAAMEALLPWLAPQPDPTATAAFSQALASALHWSAPSIRESLVPHWLAGDNPALRACALHACALSLLDPPAPIQDYLQTQDPAQLAAACHWVGAMRRRELGQELMRVAALPHPTVREAAGLALLRCGLRAEAWPLLREATLHHHALAVADDGAEPLREELRAQVLARALGHALPDLETLAAQEPLPPYLMLLTLAHVGDARGLETLVNCMEPGNPYAVRALWALCSITGLDAEAAGLCLPPQLPTELPGDAGQADEPSRSPARYLGCLQDGGLPAPDADKMRQWLHAHRRDFVDGVPLLGGREADLASCVDTLYTGQQDARLAASWQILRHGLLPQVNTADPMAEQRQRMRAWRELLEKNA